MQRSLTGCFLVSLFLGWVLVSSTASAQTGLPVPRFASLASSEVNVRVGPGKRYPIAWTFTRAGWPVEIIAEYEFWRQIRDIEGATGWIHKSLLSGRRTILITGQRRPIFEEPADNGVVVLLAEPGVQGRLLECDGPWCEVDIAGNKGWLRASHFYGVYENEKIR